ncbi:protein FAM210A [Hyla sarda]|uniref:protein FAM210A n=1 Tax=Hyla sarda TaxID=327740 RepID=UPI0024C32DEA|nr:protein FAM210A [Hyla sarda]XP_056377476.1 protein FAM210A [Hyla sarda]XP_056377477.1 protein FAM210A [Hyla sarda]
MYTLRTFYLRCYSSIKSISTLTSQACRQQQRCLISPRTGCQVLILHGQNQCFHSAPKYDSSQDKGGHQIPSPATSNPVKSDQTSSAADVPVNVDDTDPLQDKSIGLVQRFKKTFKQYGKVMVTVHVLTSSAWLGTFYFAAVKGINVVPFLEFIGLPESIVNILKNSESGNVLTAYALYKIATPVRYTVTLGGTSISVKYLRKYGYLSTPPLVKDYIQDKMEETKGRFSEKMEVTRDMISEKMEETKDRLSEKLQETKESLTFRKKKEE